MITTRTVNLTRYRPIPNEELEGTRYLGKTLGRSTTAMSRTLALLGRLYGRRGKKGFVELSSVRMAKEFGCRRSWGRLVAALVEAEWIEKDRSFRTKKSKRGPKCQGYKLAAKSLALEWVGEKKATVIKSESDGELAGVTINEKVALEILANLGLPHWSAAYFRREIEAFAPIFRIGAQTGRLFTSANRLNEELRGAVLIDGQQVAELDVKNCQPMLMATLYSTQSEEARRFRAFAQSGTFYESIGKFAGLNRKQAKAKFTVWLGGAVNILIDGFFQTYWPELAVICSEIRRSSKVALCHDLQKKESRAIVVEFPKRFGGTSVSIHDGILVPESQKECAEQILIEIFRDLYGLTPILETKTGGKSVCARPPSLNLAA